ncbi:MAG TPA: ThuA domain-containing protein [Paenibacillaceae bacterium]
MKTILAVLGDVYHPAEMAEEALREALKPVQDAALRLADAERLAEELAASPGAVVLFKMDRPVPVRGEDGAERGWLTAQVQESIARYVERGGSWLAWHSGLSFRDPDGPYGRMLRGRFLHHPDGKRIVRYAGVPDPFGLAPPEAFDLPDEHYFVECDTSATHVFLRSFSEEGESAAGWAHRHGRGKVCAFAPAHDRGGLAHPGTMDTLGRILRWLLE